MRFHIITAVWNSAKFFTGCIESIRSQQADYTVIVVDDASTDGTRDLVIDTFRYGWNCILNGENLGVPQNHWKAIGHLHEEDIDPHDVVIFVDGDDKLAPRALRRLGQIYDADPNLQLTYGQYRSEPYSPTCSLAGPYPQNVIDRRAYREHSLLGRGIPWNHLRTVRWDILSQLTERDFQFESGEWYRMSSDAAVMYPCLELAGDNFKFIEDVLYIYNSENPLSEWRKAPREGDRVHQDVLHRKPKVPVMYDPDPATRLLRLRRGLR